MASAITPFDDVPRSARGHLGILFHEAAHRVAYHLRSRALGAGESDTAPLERFPFLGHYLETLRPRLPDDLTWDDSLSWFRVVVEEWENGVDARLPLRAMRTEAGLGADAIIAFVACGLAEEDAGFARLFAELQAPLGHRRPTVALLHDLVGTGDADPWSWSEELLTSGFVEVADPDAPRSEWVLRIPAPLWGAVRGTTREQPAAGLRYHALVDLPSSDALAVTDAQRSSMATLPALLASGRARGLIVRGGFGSERFAVAASIARALERTVVEHEGPGSTAEARWRVLGPLCTLLGAVPVLTLEAAPGETIHVPRLSGHRGPLIVVMGREGGVAGPGVEGAVTIQVEPESPHERLRAWRVALGAHPVDDLARIAGECVLGGRHIREAARLAMSYAAMSRRDRVTLLDVREAERSLNRQALDMLATRLEPTRGGLDALVLPDDTMLALRAFVERCRQRERLVRAAGGIPGGVNRSAKALFEGPSGLGKTLSARALGVELGRRGDPVADGGEGLDVYRVDLAAIVNKYVGETEKNISRVLDRAEELGVVLLIDEGDGLAARRANDPRSGNDRYSNLQTLHLLQRLDSYTGIVIVATSNPGAIDAAFRRRFDVVVKFRPPTADQRLRLLRAHLGVHAVEGHVLEGIARRHELTGGQIRNAALAATLHALSRGGTVGRYDLELALRTEYEKAGASYPADATTALDDVDDSLSAFLHVAG